MSSSDSPPSVASGEARRPRRRLRVLWTAGVAVAVLAVVLVACTSVERAVIAPPEIEGAHFVGNGACVSCHTNLVRLFPDSPHGRFHRDDLVRAGETGCESCHGAGSRHVAAGGGRGQFILNPGRDPEACLRCHVEIHADLNLPYRHPLLERRVSCVDCHDPHGRDIMKPVGGLAMARLNESCAGCHQEQARPFVFVHEALLEGCVSCHQPHGSINRALLTDRGPNLCLRCHAQMATADGQLLIGKEDHAFHLQTGTCYSAGCHTAVHGSNVSPKLRY